jgi:hypothetical protein
VGAAEAADRDVPRRAGYRRPAGDAARRGQAAGTAEPGRGRPSGQRAGGLLAPARPAGGRHHAQVLLYRFDGPTTCSGAVDRQRPGQQRQPRPVRPRQTRTSARPLALGDSELMAQHQDLRVLPPRLPPRQAQHRHRTGHDQENQLQAHKPKIIPPPDEPGPACPAPKRWTDPTVICRASAQVTQVFRHPQESNRLRSCLNSPTDTNRRTAPGQSEASFQHPAVALVRNRRHRRGQPSCSSSGISSLAGIILSRRDTMAPASARAVPRSPRGRRPPALPRRAPRLPPASTAPPARQAEHHRHPRQQIRWSRTDNAVRGD